MSSGQHLKNDRLLTVKELAEAFRVSSNTVYYWKNTEGIPHVKAGKHLRFNYNEVLNYFQEKTKEDRSNCYDPFDEILSGANKGSLTIKRDSFVGSKEVRYGNK